MKKPPSYADSDNFDPAQYKPICYWCARKKWGFKDEFHGNVPLDDAFFLRLEKLGKISLDRELRNAIKSALLHYGPLTRSAGKKQASWKKIKKNAEDLIACVDDKAEDLIRTLEFHITPPWVPTRGASWWSGFSEILHQIADEADFAMHLVDATPTKKKKETKPKNEAGIELVRRCSTVYVYAGGRPTVSNNAGKYQGPFVAYLRAIWEVIPSQQRPASPNSFPRIALDHLVQPRSLALARNSEFDL